MACCRLLHLKAEVAAIWANGRKHSHVSSQADADHPSGPAGQPLAGTRSVGIPFHCCLRHATEHTHSPMSFAGNGKDYCCYAGNCYLKCMSSLCVRQQPQSQVWRAEAGWGGPSPVETRPQDCASLPNDFISQQDHHRDRTPSQRHICSPDPPLSLLIKSYV